LVRLPRCAKVPATTPDLGLREEFQISLEAKLTVLKSLLERIDKLAAKDFPQHFLGKKVVVSGTNPAGVNAEMALSQDGGLTYEAAHPMYTLVQCGGLHGHIKVSSSGIVYVPNKSCGSTQGLIVSMDNGVTFTVEPVTGSTSGTSDPSVGIGAKGRVYFGYIGGDGHPHITVSDDQGRSWHYDLDVGVPFAIHNAVFPEVVVGDNGSAGKPRHVRWGIEFP
jgi:hypothetical protein